MNSTHSLDPDSITDPFTPPPYTSEQLYQDIDLGAAFRNLDLSRGTRGAAPKPDQLIAHLKLLKAFQQLREDVSNKDGLFGINDSLAPGGVNGPPAILTKVREKRWAIYVARAVDRFQVWWEICIRGVYASRSLTLGDLAKPTIVDLPCRGKPLTFTRETLPPLDIIMVWHAYMLNPRCFLEDCIRYGLMDFWATGMPWEAVTEAIDDDFNFMEPSLSQRRNFESRTFRSWDNTKDPLHHLVKCPKCYTKNACPWYTAPRVAELTEREVVEELQGIGYGEKDFWKRCQYCNIKIDHRLLRVMKFKHDVKGLVSADMPMPGTILSISGMPEKIKGRLENHSLYFPNRLIKYWVKQGILLLNDLRDVEKDQKLPSMIDIRNLLQDTLKNKFILKMTNGSSKSLPKLAKIACRRMMSRYWDNASHFALDLVGAVIRQGVFVEKMHNINWIHSPAVLSTMTRIITKYQRFLKIIASHEKRMAVPTLDVDLAWHTHLLLSPDYYEYSVKTTKKFIDHDDKVDEEKLSDSFEWTSKTYQKMFGEVYSECTCWYCEAIRERNTPTLRFLGSNPIDTFHQNIRNNPSCCTDNHNRNVHISAHNAVRVDPISPNAPEAVQRTLRDKLEVRRRIRAHQLESAFQKACRRARKEGRQIPQRDITYFIWGFPILLAYPYSVYPYSTPDFYWSNPTCMSIGAGAIGNCAYGTCGGAVAAGNCAGLMSSGGCGGNCGGGCTGTGVCGNTGCVSTGCGGGCVGGTYAAAGDGGDGGFVSTGGGCVSSACGGGGCGGGCGGGGCGSS